MGLRPDGVPDIVWCEIPGGEVKREGVEGAFPVEPFFMAKYPITYRQYRVFLDDSDGYRSKRWWKGLKHEKGWGGQYRPIGNHPAENVSWYDAMAFCRWLSGRLGYEVRLPTEQQWQQAATGGNPDNEYPWGEWAEGRANTSESRLSRTTAVGMYPGGESVQHVLDLSGNVWEWCLNKYDDSRETDWRGEHYRVVRGGSWSGSQAYAHAAFRGRSGAWDRGDGCGFRLVCSSPIF